MEVFNVRLRKVVLFGSKARKDAHKDSDVDVLVLLDAVTMQDSSRIYQLVTKTFLMTGNYLSVKVYGSKEYAAKKQRNNVFVQEIEHDAIEL